MRTGETNQQPVLDDEDLSGAAEPDDELPEAPGADDPSGNDED